MTTNSNRFLYHTRLFLSITVLSLIPTLKIQAQAPKTYTSSEILHQLKKLNTVGSVLYIAAHPDDENTRLIAYLANEKCLRTGYLSLTRGDGGQNLIGPEQGVELGVIRTQELLAARRIDGGEQYFTRAYDFGFSKTPEETFTKWNHDSVLSDVVWVIRNFRPDIIITRFGTDGSGGHGHHTASAILAEEAFDAAADPKRFPEQLQYVGVWQTRRMFYNTVARFRDPNADMSAYIPLNVGGYNTLLGKSYGEISAESRSMHKSQGFGSARQRGDFMEHFKSVKGDTAGLKDIFQGMDFSWTREKGGEKTAELINRIIREYKPEQPYLSTALTYKLLNELRSVNNTHREYERVQCTRIIEAMNGFFYELVADKPTFSIDDSVKFTLNIINRSPLKPGFRNVIADDQDAYRKIMLKQDSLLSKKFVYGLTNATVHNGTYWLEHPISNSLFDIRQQELIGLPELYQNKSVNLILDHTSSSGIEDNLSVTYPKIVYKWVDPEKGELYRPLVITPPVMINPANEILTFTDGGPREINVVVRAGKDNASGILTAKYAAGWKVLIKGSKANFSSPHPTETSTSFSLSKKGAEETITFIVTPSEITSGDRLNFEVKVDGITYTTGIREIKYDHIPVQTIFPEAEVKLVKLDVKRKLERIGYIPGAGDEVQGSLSQLGYEVITLTDDMLAKENLSGFEAIVTGVRAYNTNEKLPSFKQKLMEYVAGGGNLIVQYNTNSWAGPLSSDIGPYKFKITRDRITDEQAKVNFELPEHPVLNIPNKITAADFEGWIQEKSIYHAGDWDSNYVAPVSMSDPGEKQNKGALIIAKHGKGHFIYTGFVFFRELPAGVPGAYRLMVNLIELGK